MRIASACILELAFYIPSYIKLIYPPISKNYCDSLEWRYSHPKLEQAFYKQRIIYEINQVNWLWFTSIAIKYL